MSSRRPEKFLLEDTSYKQKENRIEIIELFSTILIITGFILSASTLFGDVNGSVVFYIVGILASGILILAHNRGKMELIADIAVLAVAAITFLVNLSGVYRGLIYMANQCITAWNTKFQDYVTLFALNQISDMDRICFGMVAILLSSFLFAKLIERHASCTLTIFIFVFLFAAVYFRIAQSVPGALMIIMGWGMLWMMDTLVHHPMWKNVILACALALFCVGSLLGTKNYTGNVTVDHIRKSAQDQWEEFRYGSDTLPQGKLTKAAAMIGSSSENRLTIGFSKAQEMYLRGYVGSEYDGKQWTERNKGAYVTDTASGLLDWLQRQKFYVAAQYYSYKTAQNNGEPDTRKFTVDNVGAYRKYAYLPYETQPLSERGIAQEYDWQYQATGIRGVGSYEFSSAEVEVPGELMVAQLGSSKQATSYADTENVYRTFVYDNYLDITEDEKTALKEIFFTGQDWTTANVNQITTQIRLILQGQASYSDKPSAYQGSEDFIQWFLNTAKQGNAAYFATAATMAYRAAGIPARYVEGYYLSDSTAASLNTAKEKSTTLSSADAHAWTEIYMDGIGWMPVEVVPGFYFAEYTTQQVLNAPQSSVTITNQDQQEKLNGSTTDQLESKGDKKKKTAKEVVKQTIHILGILLIIAIVLELLWLLIQLQAKLRKGHHDSQMKHLKGEALSVYAYNYMCRILTIDHVPGEERFPYERSIDVADSYEDIDEADYERFLEILQKLKFGEEELQHPEEIAMKAFISKLRKNSYQDTTKWERILKKFWYVI